MQVLYLTKEIAKIPFGIVFHYTRIGSANTYSVRCEEMVPTNGKVRSQSSFTMDCNSRTVTDSDIATLHAASEVLLLCVCPAATWDMYIGARASVRQSFPRTSQLGGKRG